MGGLVLAEGGRMGLLALDVLLVGCWFLIMLPVKPVKRTRLVIIPTGDRGEGWGGILAPVPGVLDWHYVEEEARLYLRLDPDQCPPECLEGLQVRLQGAR